MLRGNSKRFLERYETYMYGGNALWAEPEEATGVGEIVGDELFARHNRLDRDRDEDSVAVHKAAHRVLTDALDVVNYAAPSTERRANILHGVINALVSNGALGGEREWAELSGETAAAPDTP